MSLAADFGRDLRFGFRNILRNYAFAGMAIGSLALGIGATAAMYSVIYAVVISPFPYKDVSRLMSIRVADPASQRGRLYYDVDQYVEFAKRSKIFEGVIASTISDVLWTGEGDPESLRGNHVSMNTFDVMGVPPLIGRTVVASDSEPAAEPIAILGYRFWQTRFGGNAGVLGRKMKLNNKIRTVVGVMPKRFMWRGADVYLPVIYRHGETPEGVHDVHVLGRLKPGVTAAEAEGDLRPIVEDLQRQAPADFPKQWRVSLLPFTETFPSDIREALWILFGAVGLLLLIACVNVSTLLLSKATSRTREIAVRASLGASRWRIIRQLLSEGLVMSAFGGILGIALAYLGLRGILALVPLGTIPDEAQVSMNVQVLLFTCAISVFAALLFAFAPAIQASATDLIEPLKEAGRGNSGSLRQRALRSGLVVGEIALSLVLLVGATLMIRTLLARQSAGTGVPADRILTLRLPMPDDRYPSVASRAAFLADVVQRTRAVPGVVAASLNTGVHPMGNWGTAVEVAGSSTQDNRRIMLHQTDEQYLATTGIPVVRGRAFDDHEVRRAAHVAMVNEAFVHRYLEQKDPIGTIVKIQELTSRELHADDPHVMVVGVVRDTMNRIYTGETIPEIYIPYTIGGKANMLLVRSAMPPEGLATAIRAEVHAANKEQPVTMVKTLGTVIEEFVYARPRFNLLLLSVFAVLGLSLSLLGIYGVISHNVAQRKHEIGIRIALGASMPDVLGMVFSSGLRLLGFGILTGLVASYFAVRVLARQVYSISTLDPYSFVAVSALIVITGLLACWWPARNAARTDPVQALRHE